MADLIFCAICEQDVSHDGAYVATDDGPMHRSCFVDRASDQARAWGSWTVAGTFTPGLNFNPDDLPESSRMQPQEGDTP